MRVLLLAPGADTATRVPVLACRDALRRGAEVEVVALASDADVDGALDRADGASDGSAARLVVAGGDGPLRAVVRRMVRRALPRAGERPPDLPDDRTVRDLPAVGVLPLDPVDPAAVPDLASRLGLPRAPADVAAAVLDGGVRRVDLLRNDGGSLTLHGALLGAADENGRPLGWQARVEVDDLTLSDGSEPLLACAVANGSGYTVVGGLPLLVAADPADGVLDVGVAVPSAGSGDVEVRRARGRAAVIAPVSPEVPYTDDGVDGTLTRKRTWWMEHHAWAVYAPPAPPPPPN